VLDVIRVLETEAHEYLTVVFDTLDWLEPLLWEHICNRDGVANIEAYGYGKGYVAALDEWRVFLSKLERLQLAKGLNIVLLAHSWIKPFKNPEGEDFDRYEMKLNAKASALIREWAQDCLFTNYQTFAEKDARTKRVKGVSTGARLIYTNRCAAYDAKNRHNLPDELPLSWEAFDDACGTGTPVDTATLKAEIARKCALAPAAFAKKVLEGVERAGDDGEKLSYLNNLINVKLASAEQKEGQQS
jgi:hypothetical protein